MAESLGKRLEKAGKTVFVRLLSGFFAPPPIQQPVLNGSASLLFLRQDKLGDMVISTGLFRLLKKNFPGIRIAVVASRSNAQVVRESPDIDSLHVYDKRPLPTLRLLYSLRKERFDHVVNLVLYSSLTGALFASLAGGRHAWRTRMTQGDDKDGFYHLNVKKTVWGGATRTMLEETADLLGRLGADYSPESIAPRVVLPEAAVAKAAHWAGRLPRGIRVGVNLAAGVPERQPIPEFWKAFLDHFASIHPEITLCLFSPRGGAVFNRLTALGFPVQARTIPDHAGVMEASAYLAHMDAAVSPDTSIVHFCSALGIPVLSLHNSAENAILWKAYGVPVTQIVAPGDDITRLDPALAVRALEKLLENTQKIKPR